MLDARGARGGVVDRAAVARAEARRRLRWPVVFLRAFDGHVLAITALALLATWLSIRWGVVADLPGEIIAVAIVFPIVFSIQASYKRREDALRYLGRLRGMLSGLYLAHRDWPRTDREAHAARGAEVCRALDVSICRALSAGSTADAATLQDVGARFSDMSRSIEVLRDAGVQGAELSRVNQYLGLTLGDYENLRAIVEYRTPASLRAHSKMFLNIFPILYAPDYAHIAQEGGAWLGYAVAAAVAVVLAGLDNIQDGLENPFDSRGVDDVRLSGGALLLPPSSEPEG